MIKHAGVNNWAIYGRCRASALVLTLLASVFAAATQAAAPSPVVASAATAELAEDAYIWAYPMLQNYQTMYRMVVSGRNKLNEFAHRRKLLDPTFKTVVGPNNDTLYSSVWLDLRNGPVRITVPPVEGGRYWSIQFIDLLVHNFAYAGSRATGSGGGTYAIAGPADRDKPIAGADVVFHSESDFVFAIVRILVDDANDALTVNALQDRFHVQAPSTRAGDVIDFPRFDAAAMQTHQFVGVLNFLLRYIDLQPDDVARVNRYAAIGISRNGVGASVPSDPSVMAAIDEGVKHALQEISARTKAVGRVVNGWTTTTHGFGSREQIAGDLLAKAAAAKVGLYGNSPEENKSCWTQAGPDGKPLDGAANRYTIRFERGQLPPARAFWSLTMYTVPDLLLYANPIDRYSIGDRTRSLRYDKDGALTIHIQHKRPDDDKLGNWLPAPPGPFAVALRMYLPATDAAGQAWKPPEVGVATQ